MISSYALVTYRSMLTGKYLRLSKQKFSSNVVERNLRSSSPNWRRIIIRELTSQPAVGEVLRDRYGTWLGVN